MKTNKSYTKRLKVTKTGKILAKKSGGNHYNAREKRTDQLARRKWGRINLKNKIKNRFLGK